MQITFFDDKTDLVSPQNWVVAAIAELYGSHPVGLICDGRQDIHTVVRDRFPEARLLLFDRDLFYGRDPEQLEQIRNFVASPAQRVWHVSHYENGSTPTRIFHDLVSDLPATELIVKTGTVRSEFTPDNYFPEAGRKVNRIFAVSKDTKREIEEQCEVPGERILVNYMGADREIFAPENAAPRAEIRNRWEIAADRRLFGLVGSLEPRKAPHRSVEVFARVAKDHADIDLAFAGRGSLEGSLRELAERLGIADRVHFLGYQRDVMSVMAALDVLLLYSEREGAVPRVMVEALAMETPVIAVDMGGISEVLEDGLNGLLIPPDDTESFEAAVRKLAADEPYRTTLGRGALSSVARFDRREQIRRFARQVVE